MNTAFLLMAQYAGRAVIPIEIVQADYFPHLQLEQLVRKMCRGEIKLPLMRIEGSQKAARGVHLQDLAAYLDARRAAAAKELEQMTRP
ncbi:pyocin activator protein PrtN [Rhodopseudomonas faecalis]|uniref:Pyocin activator protein PrtN n=1 Tax=Rhodopseudomonas faecalis TaxID=99655 RepID=A0A318TJT7_9BRAD|nr:pyocin activator PrtN family protein [Rhodopseudomonas faecalis]PYF04976.1 pyocin activator protein PrtN [Rhodopseudomonas faecalis]